MSLLLQWPHDVDRSSDIGADVELSELFDQATSAGAMVQLDPYASFFEIAQGGRKVELIRRGRGRRIVPGQPTSDRQRLWEVIVQDDLVYFRLGPLFGIGAYACVVIGEADICEFAFRWLDGQPLSEAVGEIQFWDRSSHNAPLTVSPSFAAELTQNPAVLQPPQCQHHHDYDAAEIRQLFREMLGDAQFHKFLVAMPHDVTGQKLRYWQQEAWEQFQTNYPAIRLTFPELVAIFRICQLHGSELVQKQVKVFQGCVDYAHEYWEQRRKLFPNAPLPLFSTEGRTMQKQSTAIWYCPECERVERESKWQGG
ncbi:hypothetical protein [Blastopirellula retiformator]|uniref:Uncharacterized protein n=1 Tax=Blastopirellula retiformator TaxID=2527970 RepID=A0A5C5V7C5_9BACT|nr:hypothetical protein [Blastopirellula retiformator]TWT34484.1 hypothetical protein Enr8_18930 [Blastopirellula retiformator]